MSTIRDDTANIVDDQASNEARSDFGRRFSALLREKGLSQADLARVTGEAKSKISAYAKGERFPQADTAVAIADALDVTVPHLITGREERISKGFSVPILDIRLSAGAGAYSAEKLAVGHIVLDEELMRQIGRSDTDGLVVMKGEGDSMEPLIRDGAPILVDERDTRLREGFIYAFRIGDDLRVKRLRPVGLGDIEISSVNPLYPPEVLEGEIRDHFQIIGRALLSWTRL